jgi:hypothetical protein
VSAPSESSGAQKGRSQSGRSSRAASSEAVPLDSTNGKIMRYGKNVKGREFEVVDEDGKSITGFDSHDEAVKFAKSLPWYYGEVWIRRDEEIVKERDQRAKDWFEAHGRWWLYEAA